MYYIYIMSNGNDTTLYIGITNNIERRVAEHRTADPYSFTSRYKCHKLVYIEAFSSRIEAIEREKQLKSWKRKKKDALIDSVNPRREDMMPM